MTTTVGSFRICNFKGHFRLHRKIHPTQTFAHLPSNVRVKRCCNFTVIRPSLDKVVFTLFHSSNHVNFSGIRQFIEIPNALRAFNKLFESSVQIGDVIIDNTTIAGRLMIDGVHFIHLKKLKKATEEISHGDAHLSLRPHFFPGGVLRRKNSPTIILFGSGRYVILGTKTPCQVRTTMEFLHALIHRMSSSLIL